MSFHKEWFENWFDSKYYPILYNNRDINEAANFVDNLMNNLNLDKNAIVCDLACGEGRYSFQLSKHVNHVIGFDLSPSRIQAAISKYASNKIAFYEHDMRTPMHVNYFDAIFNFFTSFGYFNTYRDHKNAAQSIANGLKKDGIFVIDYLNAHKIINNITAEETQIKDNITFNIKRYISNKKIIKEIEIKDPNEQRTYNFIERVSEVYQDDFEKLFKSVGLTLMKTFGNYELAPFNEQESPRLIMIFKK